jgi:hypothetical protein
MQPKSGQIGRRTPPFGDTGFDRRHRYLREATGDQGGEDHAERWRSLIIGGGAGEQETSATANNLLRPRGDAGIGRVEAETVPALDGAHLLAEATSQGEEVLRVALGVDASPEASHGVRGQRRRYEEPPRFEIEGCVHGCSNLLVYVPLGAYLSSPVAHWPIYTEGNKHG